MPDALIWKGPGLELTSSINVLDNCGPPIYICLSVAFTFGTIP